MSTLEGPQDVPRYSSIVTLIFDEENQRQLAWLPGAVHLAADDVVELGQPNRDAVVLGVRLQLSQLINSDGLAGEATLVVLVSDGDAQEFVQRPGIDRLLD